MSFDRFALTQFFVDDSVRPGTLRHGLWHEPDIDLTTYDTYTITAADIGRLDLVAWKYYRDPEYWPIIARVNGIRNQFTDLTIGMSLIIPKLEKISKAMGVGEPKNAG